MENMDYPKRKSQHAVGDRAVDIFKVRLPREWIKNEARRDYGWDIWLTISEDELVRESVFVQLKGSDEPNYIENRTKISVSLKVSTVNWLLEMTVGFVNASSWPPRPAQASVPVTTLPIGHIAVWKTA